jgi:hypothetical protein
MVQDRHKNTSNAASRRTSQIREPKVLHVDSLCAIKRNIFGTLPEQLTDITILNLFYASVECRRYRACVTNNFFEGAGGGPLLPSALWVIRREEDQDCETEDPEAQIREQ